VIEPFCGGASYSIVHEPKRVRLYDKAPDIVACWNYLINADPADILALPCENLQVGQDLAKLDCPFGAQVLIRLWQRIGRNDCNTVSGWNNTPGNWCAGTRAYIAESVTKIRHWTCECASYDAVPNTDATWFCDPPYQGQRTGYRREFGPAMLDYTDLGDWAGTRDGLVIVCEDAAAGWLPFRAVGESPSGKCRAGGKHTRAVGQTRRAQEGAWIFDSREIARRV
jgi:hypothetical protein